MMLYFKHVIAIVLFLSVLSGCAVVPKFSDESALENCQVFTRKIELDHIGIGSQESSSSNSGHGGGIGSCYDCGEAMLYIVGAIAVVYVTSAIISGSIYVVGNSAHYLEKKGRCDNEEVTDEVAIFSKKLESIGGKKIELEEGNTVIREKN